MKTGNLIRKALNETGILIKKIQTGEAVFLRRVIVLLSGSVLAQALPIIIAPLLTRIFSPEDIGLWGLYAAAASIGGIFVTMRYEAAILLPRENSDAAAIVLFSLGSSLLFTLLFFSMLFSNNGEILTLVGLGPIKSFWPWIPIGIAATAFFQILSVWSIRAVRFSNLAFARIHQATAGAVLQVGVGLINTNAVALLGGQVIGQLLGISTMLKDLWRHDKAKFADQKSCDQISSVPNFFITGRLIERSRKLCPPLHFRYLFWSNHRWLLCSDATGSGCSGCFDRECRS